MGRKKKPQIPIDTQVAPLIYIEERRSRPYDNCNVGESFVVRDTSYRSAYQAVWMRNKRATNGTKFVVAIDAKEHNAVRVIRVA